MRIRIAATLMVLSPFVVTAADLAIGDSVFLKEGAKGKIGAIVIDAIAIPFPAVIEDMEVDGERVLLENAWFRSRDVRTTEEALKHYSEQIQLAPDRADLWRRRGCILTEMNRADDSRRDFTEAIRDFTEAIKLDPKLAEAYFGRGEALRRSFGYEHAIKDFTETIKLEPKSPRAYGRRADVWMEFNEIDKSFNDYTEAFRLGLKDAAAYFNRSCLWSMKSELVEDSKIKATYGANALKDLNESIEVDPEFAAAYLYRAWIWQAKGEFAKAVADFEENIRLNPNPAAGAHIHLASLLATCPDERWRDGQKAVELATKPCEMSAGKNWMCVDTLAAAYAESSDFANAVKWGEAALKLAVEEQKQQSTDRLDLYRANKPFRQARNKPAE